jgi:hypothetical protein
MSENPIKDAISKKEVLKPSFMKEVVKEEPKEEAQGKIEVPTFSQQLSEAQTYYDSLNKKVNDGIKELNEVQSIIADLAEKVEKEIPKETSQQSVLNFLSSKAGVLQNRAARIGLIQESGIDLKNLAKDLKSPLDSKMSRKKK